MSQQACFSSHSAGGQAEMLILDGDFDRSNVAQFEHELQQALQVSGVKLILDLRGVSSLDSTMRSLLVRIFGAAAGHGGNLALIRPNPVVWRVFVLTEQSQSVPAFGRLESSGELSAGSEPSHRATRVTKSGGRCATGKPLRSNSSGRGRSTASEVGSASPSIGSSLSPNICRSMARAVLGWVSLIRGPPFVVPVAAVRRQRTGPLWSTRLLQSWWKKAN